MDPFVLPPALERGDRVAVIRPGNGPGKTEFPDFYDLGLKRLREVFGLEPVEFPTCEMEPEYLTEHPERRAEDVMDAFQDDEIGGVIATIGGSNEQINVLDHLDGDVLRKNPTRFYGISDNTSLCLYLWNRGIISFYGGQLMNQIAFPGETPEYSAKYLERAFFGDGPGEIGPAVEFTDQDLEWGEPDNVDNYKEFEENPGWTWYNPGDVVEGRVWGGCLEIIDRWLEEDTYLPDPEDLEGTVLALETSEKMPDRAFVEDFMREIGEGGILEKFSAVLAGRAKARSHVRERPADERERYRREQRDAIKGGIDRYAPGTPAVFDLDFGHTDPAVPIPIGGKVKIDTQERSITFQ